MEKRLECVEGDTAKFWEIKVTGSKTIISYGKIGTTGRAQTKDHGAAATASKFAEKMIKDKEKKGYAESSSGALNCIARSNICSGTKRDAPAAVEGAKGGARRGHSAAGRAAKRSKKTDSDEEEEEEEEDQTKEVELDQKKEEGEKKWPAPVLGLGGPVLWHAALSADSSYALFVEAKSVWVGSEDGTVVELSHDGKLKRAFHLPVGVKCIVGDDPFLYAGCNDGTLYDLTAGVPRLMCKLDVSSQVLWMDIKYGMLAASDEHGGVALINCEGETVWSKKPEKAGSGWMCRMDETGIYHGTSNGVAKYDLSGNVLWRQVDPRVRGVTFGCQDAEHVYPAVTDYIAKIDKRNGEIKHLFPAEYPSSNAVSADGKYVIPSSPFVCYDATGKFVWKFPHRGGFASMAFYGNDRLFALNDSIVCYDLSPAAVAKAESEKHKMPAKQRLVITKPVAVSETVETTADRSKGIVCECSQEDGKLRVHVTHQGYNASWNVQFPQAIREAGAQYLVEQIIESKQGGFYRALGEIKRLSA